MSYIVYKYIYTTMARLWLYYNYGPEVNAVSGGTRGAPQLATQVKRIFFSSKISHFRQISESPPPLFTSWRHYLRFGSTIYGLKVVSANNVFIFDHAAQF